jgi:hypothetical protein
VTAVASSLAAASAALVNRQDYPVVVELSEAPATGG